MDREKPKISLGGGLHEQGRLAIEDAEGRDHEGMDIAFVDVSMEAVPANVIAHHTLERARVEESVTAVWTPSTK